jgi:hypothetical protein
MLSKARENRVDTDFAQVTSRSGTNSLDRREEADLQLLMILYLVIKAIFIKSKSKAKTSLSQNENYI